MFDKGWHTIHCQLMTWHINIDVQVYLGYLDTKGHLWYLPTERYFWYLSIKLENFQNWKKMLADRVGFGFIWVERTHLQSDIVRKLYTDSGRDWTVWEGWKLFITSQAPQLLRPQEKLVLLSSSITKEELCLRSSPTRKINLPYPRKRTIHVSDWQRIASQVWLSN